jgi:hypothetical protein
LAFLAGLIWLAILFQQNAGPLTAISPTATEFGREIRSVSAPTFDPITKTPPLVPVETESTSEQMKSVTPILSPTPVQIFHEVKPGKVPGNTAAAYGIRVDLLVFAGD